MLNGGGASAAASALWAWMSEGDMLSKLQEKRAEEEAAAWKQRGASNGRAC